MKTGLTKAQIRSKILLKLKSQKEEERGRKSRLIKNKLFRTQLFKQAKTVMFYVAFGGEVQTDEMIAQARKKGKIVTVPVSRKHRIALSPCLLEEGAKLQRGLYGVSEPAAKRFLRRSDLDLVIVPGIAFDKKGRRLGRGKGCYDRFLKALPKDTPTIGLAFDFQVLPEIPATAHDVGVKKFISN